MPLTILPREQSWQSTLGSGLAQGLNALTQNKMKQITASKTAELFQNAGYTPEASHLLAHLQQTNPNQFKDFVLGLGEGAMQQPEQQMGQQGFGPQQGFTQSPQPQQIAPVFGKKKSDSKMQDDFLKFEKYKDKLAPDIEYINDLKGTINAMLEDIENGQVNFNVGTALASQLPFGLGNQLLNEDTGDFNHLSNKFITDATQKAKGVRSVYHIKTIAGSKPGLDKTKEQNLKLLRRWKNQLDEKEAHFYKAHPFMRLGDSSSDEGLPNPAEFKEGDIINNGQMRLKVVNGQWKAI